MSQTEALESAKEKLKAAIEQGSEVTLTIDEAAALYGITENVAYMDISKQQPRVITPSDY